MGEALQRALAGEPVTLVVGGEAGVGKSRLIGELVSRARAAGTRALIGGCVELDGGGIPLAPLVDMLRALAAELPGDELDALLGSARGEIGRLVPELSGESEAPAPTDPDPSRILELLLGVIGRVAERPLLLVIEDVQWADRATLDMIALLVAAPTARRLLLVFSVRSDELPRAHPFRRISARWEQQRAVERLELERLSAAEVAAQILAIMGERPDGDLIDLVFERSEGIPLFVEELLGAVREGGLGPDYLPPSLRDVLLARAERLSPDAQHVLRVASGGGRWVPDVLLGLVARLPDSELYASLREAIEHQLLVVDAGGRGFGFRHALARAAIHEDLLPGERAQLHRAYAEAMESRPELVTAGLDGVAMLAHHWLAAHDVARALVASVRAGRVAAGAMAPSAAQRHFEVALELWPQVPDAGHRAGIAHPELLDAAAEAAYRAAGGDRALALVDQALEEVGYGGTLEQRAMLLARRASILRDLGRDEEGIAVLEQAAGLLPPELPSRVSAYVLGQLANAMLRVDQMQRASIIGERAASSAQAVGAVAELLDAQVTAGHAQVSCGDVEIGLARVREAGQRAISAGLTWIAARAFINLSDLLLSLGRYDEAVEAAEAGMAVAERAGTLRTVGAFLRANRAEALIRAGRWDEARTALAPEREAAGTFAAAILMLRGELHVLSGRTVEARGDLREIRQHLRNTAAPQWALPLAAIEADLARVEGDLDAARAMLDRALTGLTPGEEPRYRWPVMSLAMQVEAEQAIRARDEGAEVPADVESRAGDLLRDADTLPTATPSDYGHLALLQAEHARLRGVGETTAWEAAVSAARAMHQPFFVAYALMRQAEAFVATADPVAATAGATEAQALAADLGAAPLLGQVEALIRRARLRPDDATTGQTEALLAAKSAAETDTTDRFGLTQRELEVLRLVADGCSNGQIAQQLFISRATASVHVSNILSKLGVATRVQAAALAHRRGLAAVPANLDDKS